MKATRLAVLAVLACSAALPRAHAESAWRVEGEIAVGAPSETDSNLLVVALGCGDPYLLELYADGGGPILPKSGGEAGYFYEPGRIVASVDGRDFPLVAAGAEEAVVLFSEGSAAENFLAPLDRAFVEALRTGGTLTLRFDITPASADGGPFETHAVIPLEGAAEVLDAALSNCP